MKQLSILLFFLAACPTNNTPIESVISETPGVSQTATHGKCAKSCDLSTKENVGALYKELTGKSLEPVPKCVSHSASIPRAVAVGHFLSDLGCGLNGVFIDCCYSELQEPAALLDLGWASKSTKDREALALQFSKEVVLAFKPALEAATADFGITVNGKVTPSFTPMTANSIAGGNVTVEYWSTVPIGMMKPKAESYEKWRLTFDSKGSLANKEKIDEFEGKPSESGLLDKRN
jgi:hypothetical protein